MVNIEQLLLDMHNDLGTKLDRIGLGQQNHELEDTKRFGDIHSDIRELQGTRTTMRWFIGVVIVALVGGVVEHVMNHSNSTIAAAVTPHAR